MTAKSIISAIVLLGAVGVAGAIADTERTPTAPPVRRLTNAQPSVDALIEHFRQALIAADKQALRSLRVTQDEYLGIILPGSVEPGQPRGHWKRDEQQYFWGMLNGRSAYTEAALVQEYGGHPFRVTNVEYRKGIIEYADFKAYKKLVLTLQDDAGKVDRLSIGSVVEVDGQFKFVSYARH